VDLFFEIGVGNVDNMQENIRLAHFVQGRFERFDQRVGEFPEEAHRVGEEEGLIADHHLADCRVEGGEEFVLGKNVRFC